MPLQLDRNLCNQMAVCVSLYRHAFLAAAGTGHDQWPKGRERERERVWSGIDADQS